MYGVDDDGVNALKAARREESVPSTDPPPQIIGTLIALPESELDGAGDQSAGYQI
jgi:hypothetical protein